jgi:signal transduction histidine kinase
LGLAAALRSYVLDFDARTGLPVELNLDGEPSTEPILSSPKGSGQARRLAPEAKLSLFRVAQEALANAWKHAQAPKVEVSLSFGETAVELIVCDRGRGFVAPERLRILAEDGHFGLVGMRERMELVGGRLRLTSEPGRGTTITAWAPLPQLPHLATGGEISR